MCIVKCEHDITLTLGPMQVAPFQFNDNNELTTRISGSGFVTSSNPHTLSFVILASQNVRELPVDDIAVHCCINSNIPLPDALNALPSERRLVTVNGKLSTCGQVCITNNTKMTCVKISLDTLTVR